MNKRLLCVLVYNRSARGSVRQQRSRYGLEELRINEVPEYDQPRASGNVIITLGAVMSVLLGIPCVIMGLFAVVGFITGEKLIAGSLGALWGYAAFVGAYELNRRKFDWERGRQYCDGHLLAGTCAVSVGLAISGAMHETMPILAIFPGLSAALQANDGHQKKYRSVIHAVVLAAGLSLAIWFYTNGIIGKVWLDRVESWP